MLKLKFAFAFLALMSMAVSSKAQNPVIVKSSDSLSQLIVGEWKLVLIDDRDEFGGPPSEDSLRKIAEEREALDEIYGTSLTEEKEKEKTKEYNHRLIFNSAGETFDNSGTYGGLYFITDSTLRFGTLDYRLLELNDSNLYFIDKGEEYGKNGIFYRKCYKRVNANDSTSSRSQLKEQLQGKWKLEEVYVVEMEKERLLSWNRKVEIADTTNYAKTDHLTLTIEEDIFQMAKAGVDSTSQFRFDIADRQILHDFHDQFIILEISDSQMKLLGPFIPTMKTTLINTFRKEEP